MVFKRIFPNESVRPRWRTAFIALLASVFSAAGASHATILKTLYAIKGDGDGQAPTAGVVEIGGQLYGTTFLGGAGFGTVYTLNPATGVDKVLHTFTGGSDGGYPGAGLTALNGQLYGTTNHGGGTGNGTVFTINPTTGVETVLHSFEGGSDGSTPNPTLVVFNGLLYGAASDGGASGQGTIFQIDPKTGVEKVFYSFKGGKDGSYPRGSMTVLSGQFYSTTYNGGASGKGTVYKFDPKTRVEKVLYSFKSGKDGANPYSSLVAINGKLYGATSAGGSAGQGTVFTVGLTGVEKVLHTFAGGTDGGDVYASLTVLNGQIYGTTVSGGSSGLGTVFRVNPSTGAETVLHTFKGEGGSDGSGPQGTLFAVNGQLYGTTTGETGESVGDVFTINPSTGAEKVVYSFTGPGGNFLGGISNYNGNLFVSITTAGARGIGKIAVVNPTTRAETDLYSFKGTPDGSGSDVSLLNLNGRLYGTTSYGGNANGGTVFSIDPTTGAERVLHSFTLGTDGGYPFAPLIALKDQLYGTTTQGGTGSGTVFTVNPATGAEKVVYSFKGGSDGAYPLASLIALNGQLYGTTYYGGGSNNMGTVFVVNPSTGAEKVLYSFNGSNDGANPAVSLIGLGGELYGMTVSGGGANVGTVFVVNPSTGAEKVLYSFKGAKDGANPYSSLVAINGKLYGTTYAGGSSGEGTVFMISLAGVETVLHSFTGGVDGGGPESALINVGGTFYGLTIGGGVAHLGTVFSLTP